MSTHRQAIQREALARLRRNCTRKRGERAFRPEYRMPRIAHVTVRYHGTAKMLTQFKFWFQNYFCYH
eukprot:5510475-Amphidinium_carterae.1